mgnify:CR=1 FL=1|jgi:hypothetical protein
MSMTYQANYGYGIYVPNASFIKPKYIKDCTIDIFALDINGVLVDNYRFDQVYQTQLWSVDKEHQLEDLYFGDTIGCILPFQKEPRIFGDTNRTYEDVIASLRDEYGQYLVDDFDFESNFVKFEVVEFC